jgi:NAD-dependent dihydropyrimidine dehydrogenase PreA subunit
MAYFVAADCLDVLDRSCIEECPVDCIYEGGRKMYINPSECIDCGACEPVCPVTAISSDLRIACRPRALAGRQRRVLRPAAARPGRALGSPAAPRAREARSGRAAGRGDTGHCGAD